MIYRRQSITFQPEQDIVSKNSKAISKIYLEVLLLRKILQTIPQNKSVNTSFYGLDNTVIKNIDEKEIRFCEYKINENYYINFIDFITPNYFVRRKYNNVILKYRKKRSQINQFQ